MKKIAILTSGHPPFDERIFHKIGMSLVKYGYKVNIICSTLKVDNNVVDGISGEIQLSGFEGGNLPKKDKKKLFLDYIRKFQPDTLICCEPFTLIPAHEYKKHSNKGIRIISDITEWYPENVALKHKGFRKILIYIKLFLFNIYATNLADSLIIGETEKRRRYMLIAPLKRKEIIGYYPRLEYFTYSEPPFDGKVISLCYAGVITYERGIVTLLDIALKVAKSHPELKVKLIIVGKFSYNNEEKCFHKQLQEPVVKDTENLSVEFIPWGKYQDISYKISHADICLDLRKRTFVYRNSLPIKIFEYMACGKPVIFSDIKPIRSEIDIKKFGFLVDPDNIEEITRIISLYINDPGLLKLHSLEARSLTEKYYNWENLEQKLINFLEG